MERLTLDLLSHGLGFLQALSLTSQRFYNGAKPEGLLYF